MFGYFIASVCGWFGWKSSLCSSACGIGERASVRRWYHVMWSENPYNNGDECEGDAEKYEECNLGQCPGNDIFHIMFRLSCNHSK